MTFVMSREEEEADGVELPSEEEIEAALSVTPEELTWDWAAPRLIPLFERDYAEGFAGDPMVNTVSPGLTCDLCVRSLKPAAFDPLPAQTG
jgi:hypothetical protein